MGHGTVKAAVADAGPLIHLTEIGQLVIHATHEAGYKVGGIGAVLDGLLSQPAYNQAIRRTVLVGPFNSSDPLEMERLFSPRNKLTVRYSAHDGVYDVSNELARAFTRIELDHHVRLLYGTRRFGEAEHEILLVDPRAAIPSFTNGFKYHLWDRYGIDSWRYQRYDEYDWYIGAAEPSFAALQALINSADTPERTVLIAHEWLGLPLAFSAIRHQQRPSSECRYRTVFYAHEAGTVRVLVEGHPGHDTRFYNVMVRARQSGFFLENIFGSQRDFFKHALIMAASQLDGLFAVGDLVVDELRFLSPTFADQPIALVYNGVPSPDINLADRWLSKERLQRYAQNLFGHQPSWIFTHVTRLVLSKALWRDLRIMEKLDRQLASRGETAVLFTLSSTIPSGRRVDDVWRWEAEYGWPINHRADNGDLVGLEIDYYRAVAQFNSVARASRIVLVNQFGWSRDRCGSRMPADMEFGDIRRGTDLEFGQSIYEPFGIGQVEPLASGALCCLSNVCGCVGFINKAGGLALPNIVLADYVTLPPSWPEARLDDLLKFGQWERDIVEASEAAHAAQKSSSACHAPSVRRNACLRTVGP